MYHTEHRTVMGRGPLDNEQVELMSGDGERLSPTEIDVLQDTRFGYEVDGLEFTISGDFPGGLEHAARLAAALLLASGAKETP